MKEKLVPLLSIPLTFILIPAVIGWIGFGHVGPLFEGDFTQHLGSIEVSYIQMAKFIESSLPGFSWQSRWYMGYPMAIVYTPVVPFFEYIAHTLVGWSFGHAYRVLTAVSYVGGLVTLYFFTRSLFKNTVAGVICALFYGLLPSIIALIYDEVAQDRFGVDLVEPRRFTILVRWGEGPHIVSLLFMPLAALFWIRFLRGGSKWALVVGALFTALTALTNSVGAWGLGLLVVALTFGEIAENILHWKQTVVRTVFLGIVSYGIAAFWFNPLFLSSFFREGGGSLSYWRNQFPWGWLVILAAAAFMLFISKKILYKVPGLTAAIVYFLMMFGLVNTYYASGSEHLELVPQVLRLTTEVDIASSLLLAGGVAIIGIVFHKFKHGSKFYLGVMAAIVVLAIIVFYPCQLQLAEQLPPHTRSLEAIGKKLEDTAEYDIAMNLEAKINPNERVFVPGNYSFYLNLFTDVPQLRGALFQSALHPWSEHIYYQMVNGKDAEIAFAWLKIANIGWLLYNGPREPFGDFKIDTQKFDKTLKLIEEDEGDRFYKVPLTDSSLAKSVISEISLRKVPFNAIDKEPIVAYVKDIDDAEKGLTFTEESNGKFMIKGPVREGRVILVQQTYAPGWQAKDSQGRGLEVKKDPLGFILIKPRQAGNQEITLWYGRTWRIWIGWLLTLATITIVTYLLIKAKKPLLYFHVTHAKKEEKEE